MQSDSRTRFIPIGLMLFALFFGAGNLIFPASMGQAAGTDVWWALLGFCITGVGLPLLTVMAVGYSGLPGLREIGNRVHPWFILPTRSTSLDGDAASHPATPKKTARKIGMPTSS